MADTEVGNPARLLPDTFSRLQFAQQMLHDLGFAIQLFAVPRLQLLPEHESKAGSERQQQDRRRNRKQQSQPQRERDAEPTLWRRLGGLERTQARSSNT